MSGRLCTGRGYRARRCPRCGLRVELCLCAELQRSPCRTTIEIYGHYRDWSRPSNTGRLLPLLLEHTRVTLFGVPPSLAGSGLPQLHATPRTWLLFPEPDALTPEAAMASDGPPQRIIVPDGTWPQARRFVRRAAVGEARAIRLEPSERLDQLRRPPVLGYLSTFEAVVACLEVVESAELARRLVAVFLTWQERALKSRAGGLRGPSAIP